MIDEVGPTVDPVVLSGQLDAAKIEFRKVLASAGWSSSSVADIVAFSLVQGYVTWRQVAKVPVEGLKSLRREVRDNLALQKQVRRLSDAASRRSPRSSSCA